MEMMKSFNEEPCAGNLHAQFDVGKTVSVKKRILCLLYKTSIICASCAVFAAIGSVGFWGCVSKPAYVLKSPEQLAAQFKAEHPNAFATQEMIAVQDACKLLGEWEGELISICQTDSEYGKGIRKFSTLYTYQFFKDNTYNLISKSYGVTSVSQGIWSYKNGVLLLHTYKDNVLQRGVPMHVKWHSESLIGYQYEIDAYKKNCLHETQGEIIRLDVCYDVDGFQIYESDQKTMGVRFQSILITTPATLKRVGDAIKPSGTAGMQNPITHDEAFKSQMEVQQRMADARQREIDVGVAVSEAIVQGANAFSAAMSQQQPAIQPVAVSNPAVGSMQSAGGAASTGPKICPACFGSTKCRPCNGTGKNPTKKNAQGHIYDSAIRENCRPCNGTGNCLTCGGKGHL